MAEITQRGARLRRLPGHPDHAGRRPARLARAAADEARRGRRRRTRSTSCGRGSTRASAGRLFIAKSLPYFLELASPRVSKGSGLAFLAEHLGLHGRARRSLSATARTTSSCWSGRATRSASRTPTRRLKARADFVCPGPAEEGVAQVDRGDLPRLQRVIDLKAARADPDGFRAALARKGAAEAFDALLEADERWRALVPRVDELRGATKLKGKPTPEQLEELQRRQGGAEGGRGGARGRRGGAGRARSACAEPAAIRRCRRACARRTQRRFAASASPRSSRSRSSTPRSAASRWSGRRRSPARGSGTGSATPRCSRWRSTGWRSSGWPRRGSSRCCRPCSCARRRWSAPAGSPRPSRTSTSSPADELYLAGTAEIPLGGLHLGRAPRGRGAAAPLRRLLAVLPARGGRGGPRHARACSACTSSTRSSSSRSRGPRTRGTSTSSCSPTPRRSCATSGCPTASSILPTGDISTASAKTYDIEIWFPSQDRYRETASISNTTDFQARRLGTRYRADGAPQPVHTLNGTAVVDRMALAILENFQGDVPDVLREYGAPERVTR